MKKALYIIIAIVIILLIVVSLKNSKNNDGIVIGAVFPMTGGLASIGEELKNGVDLAVKEAGLNIKIEDGQADPQKSLTAGQSLVNITNVPVILTAFRGASISLASNLKSSDVIVLSTTATTEGKTVSTSSENFFVIGAEMISAGKAPGSYAKANNLCTQVGLVSEQSDTGKDKLAGFSEGVGKDKIAMTEFFQPNETDFKTLVSKLKSQNVDCIFVEVRSNNLPIFLADLEKQAFHPKIFANSYSVTPQGIKNSPEKQIENIIFSSTSFNTKNKRTKDFIQAYRDIYSKDPTDFSALGYELVVMLDEPLKKCGNDIVCLRTRLSSIRNYASAIGNVTMNENGEALLKEYDLFKIVDGVFSKI